MYLATDYNDNHHTISGKLKVPVFIFIFHCGTEAKLTKITTLHYITPVIFAIIMRPINPRYPFLFIAAARRKHVFMVICNYNCSHNINYDLWAKWVLKCKRKWFKCRWIRPGDSYAFVVFTVFYQETSFISQGSCFYFLQLKRIYLYVNPNM